MKILIIGPAWVGDMVMSQSLMKVLHLKHKNLSLDVVAPNWSKPLLDRMPEVRNSISLDVQHGELAIKKRRQLAKCLVKEGYDQALILPNSIKSALLPYWAKIPKRTAWRGEWRYGLVNDIRVLDKQLYPTMVSRFVALASDNSEPAVSLLEDINPKLELSSDNIAIAMEKHQLSNSKPVLVLCPGAEYGPSKQWPARYLAVVAEQFIESHNGQVWILGSEKDKIIANHIQNEMAEEYSKQSFDLTGSTSLDQAIDLMSLAAVVVSNDSGLMHIAASLELPVIVVYGSTSPEFTPPLSSRAKIIKSNEACSPCFKRECPFGHFNCLNNIKPELILEQVQILNIEQLGK